MTLVSSFIQSFDTICFVFVSMIFKKGAYLTFKSIFQKILKVVFMLFTIRSCIYRFTMLNKFIDIVINLYLNKTFITSSRFEVSE